MDSQELKNRSRSSSDRPEAINEMNPRKPKRSGMATRGFLSLAVAVSFPLALALIDIYLFRSGKTVEKPFYIPPLWALHAAFLAAAFLSGLSAWLVWADGGFHRQPLALLLYLGQLGLSLVWYPIVFWAGATRVGLVVAAALFLSLIGCSFTFKKLNPISGDLLIPCLIWPLVQAALNYRLVNHN